MLYWWYYIKRNSVKDKLNLYSYNVWSGGEYDNTLTEIVFHTGQDVTITDEYSTNGNKSFKIVKINNEPSYFAIDCKQLQINPNQIITITADIKLVQGTCNIQQRLYDSSNIQINVSYIAVNQPSEQSITMSNELDPNTSFSRFFITFVGDMGSIL